MTTANRTTPASIAELFTQYLKGQVTAREEGLGLEVRDGEVVPYDAVPVQPVDPKQAWDDGITAAKLLAADVNAWPIPHDWPGLVNVQEPAVALAFCVGNFPQIVRNLQPLLAGGDVAALRVNTGQPTAPGGLLEWASKVKEPCAVHRRRGCALSDTSFRGSGKSVKARHELACPGRKRAGRTGLAPRSIRGSRRPVAVAGFVGAGVVQSRNGSAIPRRCSVGPARPGAAVKQLPETSAWHHLGQLYLVLAANRG